LTNERISYKFCCDYIYFQGQYDHNFIGDIGCQDRQKRLELPGKLTSLAKKKPELMEISPTEIPAVNPITHLPHPSAIKSIRFRVDFQKNLARQASKRRTARTLFWLPANYTIKFHKN